MAYNMEPYNESAYYDPSDTQLDATVQRLIEERFDSVDAFTSKETQRVYFCKDCGIELDQHDVDANLNTWGDFRLLCSDCIEHNV